MTTKQAFTSIDELYDALRDLPQPDEQALQSVRRLEPQLTKPLGSLGRLEELTAFLAAWQGRYPPRAENVSVIVFAANHGVTAQGVSAYPPDVTSQMVANFEAGGAAINQLARTFDLRLDVVPLQLDQPSADFTKTPALTEADFLTAFNAGVAALSKEPDLVCLGEMGIGNTTSAAAICLALFGGEAENWTGPGTGVGTSQLMLKTKVVADAVNTHHPNLDHGLRTLQYLGGRELAALAGAIYAARINSVPVMLDGFVVTAAAAALHTVNPAALDHCEVAHVSAEPGHRALLEKLSKRALLDLDMRLGEASGAALAVALVKAAVNCHNGMATFESAGVSTDHDRQKNAVKTL